MKTTDCEGTKMIKKNSTVRASCHCGSIKLDVFLLNGLEKITSCNCSICSRGKGSGMICVPIDDCTVVQGIESMTEYIFNTSTSPHVFCILCGIHTHHKSKTTPDSLCINIACIDSTNFTKYTNNTINFD